MNSPEQTNLVFSELEKVF